MAGNLPDSTREKLEKSFVNAGGFGERMTMLVSTLWLGGLADYVFPYTVWALPVGMLAGLALALLHINDEREKRRLAVTRMSDDALISLREGRTTFRMRMARVAALLIGLFLMGLLFTERGQETLRAIGQAAR